MIINVGGETELVLVSGDYPWRYRTARLMELAETDPHVALGLDVYNAIGSDNAIASLAGLAYYNDAVACGVGCARKVAGVVREAARCQLAAECDGTRDPIVVGFSLKRLRPPKNIRKAADKIGKTAYKVSRHPALPIVAAAIPGVGPGVAAGITAYQGAMKAYDLAQAGKGSEALAEMSKVAAYAAEGNPEAQAALANIKKGAAIVNTVQKLGKASPAEVASLIASHAGVDVASVAKAYGVPVNAVTTEAISKLAQGKMPDMVKLGPELLKTPQGQELFKELQKQPGAAILQSTVARTLAAQGVKPTRENVNAASAALVKKQVPSALIKAPKTPQEAAAAKAAKEVLRARGKDTSSATASRLLKEVAQTAPRTSPGSFICECCRAHGAGTVSTVATPAAKPQRRRGGMLSF